MFLNASNQKIQTVLKKLISIVLIALYAGSLVLPLIPHAEYVLNYEHIKTHLCEERHNPESDCNGKCYLQQQVSHFQIDIKLILNSSFFALFYDGFISHTHSLNFTDIVQHDFVINMPSGYLFEILDPPQNA